MGGFYCGLLHYDGQGCCSLGERLPSFSAPSNLQKEHPVSVISASLMDFHPLSVPAAVAAAQKSTNKCHIQEPKTNGLYLYQRNNDYFTKSIIFPENVSFCTSAELLSW